jgi:hypothetical protein
MKKNNYFKILCLTALAFAGCEKILETQPAQSISPDVALTSSSGVTALLNSVYNDFGTAGNLGRDRILLPEVLADNVINTQSNNNSYRTQEVNQVGSTIGNWSQNYSIIFKTNLIVDAVDNGILKGASVTQSNLFKGEALFFRALSYFQLMQSYAYVPGNEVANFKLGVPINLIPTKGLSDVVFPIRNTNVEVYTQIKADLTSAIAILNNTGRPDKAYVSKAVAQGLLSKVHLYLKEYDAVISTSTEVINTISVNGKSTSIARNGTDLINMWRTYKDKTESLWQISKNGPDNLVNGSLQSWFSIYPKPLNSGGTGNPARASFADLRVAPLLFAAFDNNDVRKTQLIEGPYTKLGQAGLYFSNKYSGTGGIAGLDDIVVMRTSEVLLNRAEAYARKNDLQNTINAINDINIIRTRSGLTALPIITPNAEVLTEVLLQRRLELAFEGDRWFDLVRRGLNISKQPGGLSSEQFITFDDRRILAQVPQSQIDVDPLKRLIQNPGY